MDHTLDNTFESANRVYDKNQLCPTIPTCAGGDHQPKLIEETRCVGGLSDEKKSNGGTQHYQQDRVYKGDIALAQPAALPGGSYKYIVASRGRGENNAQKLEPNLTGLTNVKTSVQKDNLLMEATETNIKENGLYEQAIKTAEDHNAKGGDIVDASVIERSYRIRKLTPRECWRLMGYTDEDFNKAKSAGVSNSQLYKQAGNAIVKQVLMALFLQMGIQGKKRWNEKTPAEIYGALNNYTNMGATK